ncbi:hypothetical protein QYE76_043036 [Lolium multiflorum]|uniref:Protein FAR1-RELATED SEQUENCE n=1 Tax=Lolium multiflorum TaxID=4521 RepID=A0AAD8WXW1_LOLMU|nr:hypothetical protein QYE76_043036 [Lolium multiflorum]
MADNFVMVEGESPEEMYRRLIALAVQMQDLGATFVDDHWIKRKLYNALLPYEEVKLTAIRQNASFCAMTSDEVLSEVIALDISKKNAEDLVARAHNNHKPNLALKVRDCEESESDEDPMEWSPDDLKHRVGKASPERALNSARVTALERTLRDFPARPNGEVIVPEVGVTFDSIGEAYDFYNLYSWEQVFGVRYGKSRLKVEQVKCMQEIVCGCSSVIFAGVLLREEKVENFEWIFREFVKLMSGKKPVTVLTDQCRAMEVAIGNVLTATKHRWCKWHVLRKAKERLGALYGKNSQFKVDFHRIVNQMLTKDEFEAAWMQMLSMYALEKNPYVYQIYETRDKWAKPFFSGIFCARMTSTQRCESANHMLKTYVPPGSAMHVFVKQFNKLLYDRDAEESFQEKRTHLVIPHISSMCPHTAPGLQVFD